MTTFFTKNKNSKKRTASGFQFELNFVHSLLLRKWCVRSAVVILNLKKKTLKNSKKIIRLLAGNL